MVECSEALQAAPLAFILAEREQCRNFRVSSKSRVGDTSPCSVVYGQSYPQIIATHQSPEKGLHGQHKNMTVELSGRALCTALILICLESF